MAQKIKIPKGLRVLIVISVMFISLCGIIKLMILSGSQVVEPNGAFIGKAKDQMDS